jgi:hypothetical protein
MKQPYFQDQSASLYDQERRVFAEMKEAVQLRKRRQRRRRALMWILRRL